MFGKPFLQKISRPWKTPHAKIAKFGIQRYHFTMLVQRLDSQIPPDLRLKCGNQSKKALHEAEQEIMQLAWYSVLTHRVQWFSIFNVHVDAKQYECLQSKYKGKFFYRYFSYLPSENQCLLSSETVGMLARTLRRPIKLHNMKYLPGPSSSSWQIVTQINASYIIVELQHSNIILTDYFILKSRDEIHVPDLRINNCDLSFRTRLECFCFFFFLTCQAYAIISS